MFEPTSYPERANILLIGGGGREHALAWKLKQSPRVAKLWLADAGNAGLSRLGRPFPQKVDLSNPTQMRQWCDLNEIHLVVVGPEVPLARGVTDVLMSERRQVFGPTRAAAQIEADKTFAKELMRDAGIPTAKSHGFQDPDSAKAHIRAHDEPCVVKASGLAAGKGSVVCETPEQAFDAIDRIMIRREFGEAGARILIEERLSGQEVSLLALVDGQSVRLLDPCQDHKQVGEGDTGPNTGGMGAYCPTPLLDSASLEAIHEGVLVAAVDALRCRGIDYHGVLYAGLMLTPEGPKVLEYNCRFGDPECQPLMARLRGDLFEILWASCTGALSDVWFEFDSRTACCVVMCSQGYPGPYATGKTITGIEDAEALAEDGREVLVFHAGTMISSEGYLVTKGGRVLGVTALASDLEAARDLANAACAKIHFEGAFYRRDIGHRVLAR